MTDQFQDVQQDSRNRYTTHLRFKRLNEQTNPDLTDTLDIIDRATRIFCLDSVSEITQLTDDYKHSLQKGNLVIVPDLIKGKTRIFVWIDSDTQWHETEMSVTTDVSFLSNIDGGTF